MSVGFWRVILHAPSPTLLNLALDPLNQRLDLRRCDGVGRGVVSVFDLFSCCSDADADVNILEDVAVGNNPVSERSIAFFPIWFELIVHSKSCDGLSPVRSAAVACPSTSLVAMSAPVQLRSGGARSTFDSVGLGSGEGIMRKLPAE